MNSRQRRLSHAVVAGVAVLGLSAVGAAGTASASSVPSGPLHLSQAQIRAAVAKAATMRSGTGGGGSLSTVHRAPKPDLKPLGAQLPDNPDGFMDGPLSEVVSPDGKTLYVADNGTGVWAISLADPSATPTQITDDGGAIDGPIGLAISPNGKWLYISATHTADDQANDDVEVAAIGGSGATNNTVVDQIATYSQLGMGEITGLAIAPDGQTLYAEGLTGDEELPEGVIGTIDLTNGSTGTVVSSVPDSDLIYPFGLAISPNGKLLYASNLFGTAVAMSASSKGVEDFSQLKQVTNAFDLAVSPDGRTMYASVPDPLAIFEGVAGSGSALNTFQLSSGGRGAILQRSTLLPSNTADSGITLSPSGTAGYLLVQSEQTSESDSLDPSVDTFAISAAASSVSITGKAKPGSTVTAKVKASGNSTNSYRWYADGRAISGATAQKLKLTGTLAGKKLTVKATSTAAGYYQSTVTSKAMKVSG